MSVDGEAMEMDADGSQRDRLAGREPQRSIVAQAAAILAEEVQSFTKSGVSRLATGSGPGAVGSLPLEQVRDVIDAILRALGQPPEQVARIIEQAGIRPTSGTQTQSVRLLQAGRPVPPGDVAQVSLRLMNDDTEADECVLVATDLIGISGYRIPASHVRISPHPARIQGGGAADVQIQIRVPSGAPSGCYTGLLQTDDGESLQALIQVTVRGAPGG
jgi:hypothetical protein